MITRSLLILFCLFVNSNILMGQQDGRSITVKEFTENPWKFDPTLPNIVKHYGDFLKTEKYTVKNRLNPTERDTIIRFFRGKTEIFFYKPFNGQPLFLTANISDKRIALKGDITINTTQAEVLKKISYPASGSDTLKISLPEGLYKTSVIFRENKVYQLKIEARNKKS